MGKLTCFPVRGVPGLGVWGETVRGGSEDARMRHCAFFALAGFAEIRCGAPLLARPVLPASRPGELPVIRPRSG